MTKADELNDQLCDWRTVPELTAKFKWQPHTLRSAIAATAKKRGLKIERKREDGITSYRLVDDYQPRDDFAKSVESSYDAIKERVAAGGEGWQPKKPQ